VLVDVDIDVLVMVLVVLIKGPPGVIEDTGLGDADADAVSDKVVVVVVNPLNNTVVSVMVVVDE